MNSAPESAPTPGSVAVISTAEPGVGLSGVATHIVRGLARTHTVCRLAMDQDGPGRWEQGVAVVPCGCHGLIPAQVRMAHACLSAFRPRVILWFLDFLPLGHFMPALVDLRAKGARLAAYLPIDGGLRDIAPLLDFARFDYLVFFHETTRGEFLDQLSAIQTGPGAAPRTSVIGHGSDLGCDSATTLSETERAGERRRILGITDVPRDVFIVLNGNRNWPRKRLDLSIEGFSRFARERPGTFLYLHLPGSDATDRQHLAERAAAAKVGDRVMIREDGAPVSREELHRIYAACDVGLNTTMGEGWGLVSCEHAAVGAPQVVPDHATLRELWGDAAVFTEISRTETIWHAPHLELGVTSPEAIAQALSRLHGDRTYFDRMARAGRSRMRLPQYRWEAIESAWADVFVNAELAGSGHVVAP